MPVKYKIPIAVLLICALVSSAGAAYLLFFNRGYAEVCFISVGQGDSCLIQSSGGESILIDGGDVKSGEYTLLPLFRKKFVTKLDAVFVSHMHSDHIAGIEELMENNFPIETIYVSDVADEENGYADFAQKAEKAGIELSEISDDDVLYFDELKFTVIAAGAENITDENDYSVVMRMDCGENSFLFTGDATEALESEIIDNPDIDTDFLKVAHHGSDSSSMHEFVEKVSPYYSFISVGSKNKYGHPHREVLTTMNDLNIKVMRTDADGNITITMTEDNILNIHKGRQRKEEHNDNR